MLLFETGMFFWGWDVQIIGMDISGEALDVAKRGVYYDRSFRMMDPVYLKKFFSPNSGDFKTKDNIRKITSFVKGNISEPETWKSIIDIDVIFCRNVLIYFSDDKVKAAINNYYEALRRGGYLLLGHSETLTGIFDGFNALRYPETIIYQK
jgi:chemotaxis protein methyltransferase CheR